MYGLDETLSPAVGQITQKSLIPPTAIAGLKDHKIFLPTVLSNQRD